MNCAHALRMLDAYVDRELDARTTEEMIAHLGACATCASAYDRRVAMRATLAKASLRHGAPPGLRPAIVGAIADLDRPLDRPARTARLLRWWQLAGLSASTAIAGAIAGWWLAQPGVIDSFPEYAVAQHVAALTPAGPRIDVASTDRHVVKPWFQGRIDFTPAVRDLSAQGFELLGARIDRLGERQAVAIIYRLRGHVIDVFAWRASANSSPAQREATLRGFHVLTWTDGDIGYAAVTDADNAELERFAAAYRGP